MIGDPTHTAAASRRLLVTNLAVGLAVAALVAWIDWGGVSHSISDRLLAGFFAFQGATALALGLRLRSHRYHPSWMAAQMCDAAFGAFLTVAMLTSGFVALGFGAVGIVFLSRSFANLRTYRRAIDDGTAFPRSHVPVPLVR